MASRVPGFLQLDRFPQVAVMARPGYAQKTTPWDVDKTLAAVAALGFNALVSLSDPVFAFPSDPPKYPDHSNDVEIKAKWLSSAVERRFEQVPIEDLALLTVAERAAIVADPERGICLKNFLHAVYTIRSLLDRGFKVMVYCSAALGRSPAVLAALILSEDSLLKPADAIREVCLKSSLSVIEFKENKVEAVLGEFVGFHQMLKLKCADRRK
ncbi:MAG: hypothetical protein SP1CHLAM54_02740 [Chlamydiia bacterium]|nr:hypothetical protein [Chlamydiia bacterium]MCH9615190.1 hypothetical protein [Chlamydiia bacterium]MCH9628488.1 hypothetical protein [Chlamydiia bacterium]